MARPGVEYKDVERAAREIFSRGIHPSVQKVRDKLGTGSNTTIAKHLKVWQASFAMSHIPALPESAPEALMDPLSDFWSLAVAKAETSYQQLKEQLEAKVIAAEAAQQASADQLTGKRQELESLRETLLEAEKKLHDTEQHWNTLKGQYTVTEHELGNMHNELERVHALLQQQIDASNVEIKQLKMEHDAALNHEHERTVTSENRLLNEIDQLRQTVKALKSDLSQKQNDLQTHKESANKRELVLREELSELRSINGKLDTECKQHKEYLGERKTQLSIVQGQLSQSLAMAEALRLDLEQTKENEIHLMEQIGELNETINDLQHAKKE